MSHLNEYGEIENSVMSFVVDYFIEKGFECLRYPSQCPKKRGLRAEFLVNQDSRMTKLFLFGRNGKIT